MGDPKRAYRIPRYEDDVFDTVIRLVEEGTWLKDATIEAGVSRGTASRWMRKARKGQRLKPIGRAARPRKDEYHRRRREGLTVIQATKRIGVTNSSGYNWDKELQKAASASQRPRGDSTGFNRVMRPGQLLAGSDTNPRFLSLSERETIRDLRQAGTSMRQIAIRLGRHVSTVSREITRNKDARGDYLPYGAQRMAVLRRAWPKQPKLVASPRLHDWVQERLRRQWSPAQISAILVREFPDDPEMRVCPETVYQALYLQARGGLKKEVQAAMRTGRTRRKPRGQHRQSRVLGDEMIMISDRPAEVEDRAVPGHWEGDLIIGARGKSAIATLVERSTRFVMLCHLVGDHTAATVTAAIAAQMTTLPRHLRRSLTWYQGAVKPRVS